MSNFSVAKAILTAESSVAVKLLDKLAAKAGVFAAFMCEKSILFIVPASDIKNSSVSAGVAANSV